jgi:hypothetical protein
MLKVGLHGVGENVLCIWGVLLGALTVCRGQLQKRQP